MPATHSKLTSWSTGSSDAFETWLQQTKGFWLRKDVWEIIQDGDPAETGKKTTKTIDQVAVQRMAVVMQDTDVEEPMYNVRPERPPCNGLGGPHHHYNGV
jgi:hypothetical protein